MSESKGQLKFNVVNRGRVTVQVPGTDGINGSLSQVIIYSEVGKS
jgi:hypothetical protein